MFAQFPIIRELTNLHQPTTGRRSKQSIAEVVADLDKHIIQAFTDVTYETGPGAREKLLIAFNRFTNMTKTHRSLRYAVICYIWAHHDKSNVKGQVASIIQDYALAPSNTEVKALLAACSNGHTCNFMLRSSLITVDQLPGVKRLKTNLSMTNQEFDYATSQWLILWQCMCNFICQHDFSKPKISLLDEWLMQFDISKGGRASLTEIENHPFCEQNVSVQSNHSKMHQALLQIEAAAHHDKQMSRIPSDDALKKNLGIIIVTAHKSTWARLFQLVDTHDLNVDTMTYEVFTKTIFRAECQCSARSKVLAYVQSLTTATVSVPQETNTENKTRSPHHTAGNDSPKSDKPGIPPIYIKQGPLGYILECLVGPGVMASDLDRKLAHDTGGCSNCLLFKFKKYGNHTMLTCPYTTPNCEPRSTTHIPMTVVNGKQPSQLHASDPTTVKKFIDERKLLLSPAPAVPNVPDRYAVKLFPINRDASEDENEENQAKNGEITVPNEPEPTGPIRAPSSTWRRSARTHHMMITFQLSDTRVT